MDRLMPMIHVPDVGSTLEWYGSLGFALLETNEVDGVVDWAMMGLGESRLMLNAGGRPGTGGRRDVDIYIETDDLDALYARLKGQVEVLEGPHETFYGMREFVVRDPNGFWVTFGSLV